MKTTNILKQLFGGVATAGLKELIKDGAFLVDAGTVIEFADGHVKGSLNIPLDTLPNQIATFKNKKTSLNFAAAAQGAARVNLFYNKTVLPM